MGSLGGPAHRYPITLGDDVAYHADGIGKGGEPLRHRSLEVLWSGQAGMRRAVVNVVAGQDLVGYVEVARIEKVFNES